MQKKKVLFVEAEESVRISLKYYLKSRVLKFHTVESAEEGLVCMKRGSWDVVISDYQLPDMNGIDFLKTVKTELPDMMTILIIAYGSLELAKEADKAGVDGFIETPFTTRDIMDSLSRLILGKNERLRNRGVDEKSGVGRRAPISIRRCPLPPE